MVAFPQASVIEYVLVIVSGHVFQSDTSFTKATTGVEQLSDSSVIKLTSDAGTSPMHSIFTVAGAVAVGAVISRTVIVCVTKICPKHASVTE